MAAVSKYAITNIAAWTSTVEEKVEEYYSLKLQAALSVSRPEPPRTRLSRTSLNTEQPDDHMFITQGLHPLGLGADKLHCQAQNPEQLLLPTPVSFHATRPAVAQ